MAWTIKLLDSASRELRKLDRQSATRIRTFLYRRLASLDDPRSVGHGLTGPFKGLWRYRVGDFRIVCDVKDETLLVLVVRIGHRSDIYR